MQIGDEVAKRPEHQVLSKTKDSSVQGLLTFAGADEPIVGREAAPEPAEAQVPVLPKPAEEPHTAVAVPRRCAKVRTHGYSSQNTQIF